MAQIHHWMLHGYKNSKFQISTRGLYKAMEEWQKSRENKEEFIKRVYVSEDRKQRKTEVLCVGYLQKERCAHLGFFFTVLMMEELKLKYIFIGKKNYSEKTPQLFVPAVKHTTKPDSASVITSKPSLIVGSRTLISWGCLYLALRPQRSCRQCQKTYLKL